MLLKCCLIGLLGVSAGAAQIRRVDSHLLYERILAIVPLVGKGTLADPIRPMFAPATGLVEPPEQRPLPTDKKDTPQEKEKKQKTEILAYSWVLSDDKRSAVVEFVARDKAAFEEIKKSPAAKLFARDEIGRTANGRLDLSRENVELEIKKVRKDFTLNDLRTSVP